MSDKKPIKQLFVGEATVMEVGVKPKSNYKGKDYPPKIFVEVKTEDNRWMLIQFKVGDKFDDKKLDAFLKSFGLAAKKDLPSMKGKKIAVSVIPVPWNEKTIWEVKGHNLKYLKDEMEAALDDMDSLFSDDSKSDDNIPF